MALYKLDYYASAQGALSDDAVWRLSVWRLSRTSGRRVACAAGRLDGAYWLIEPGSAGLAQGCCCALPLQAWAGAYRGGRPPTACYYYYYVT